MNSYLNDRKAIDRLKREYQEHGKLVIGCDFDDTIFPFNDVDTKDVVTLLKRCKEAGFILCLWSTCYNEGDIKYKAEICKNWGLEMDHLQESSIFTGTKKPYFSILLDDRAGLSAAYKILKETLDSLDL